MSDVLPAEKYMSDDLPAQKIAICDKSVHGTGAPVTLLRACGAASWGGSRFSFACILRDCVRWSPIRRTWAWRHGSAWAMARPRPNVSQSGCDDALLRCMPPYMIYLFPRICQSPKVYFLATYILATWCTSQLETGKALAPILASPSHCMMPKTTSAPNHRNSIYLGYSRTTSCAVRD